jgi:hypothetical protein
MHNCNRIIIVETTLIAELTVEIIDREITFSKQGLECGQSADSSGAGQDGLVQVAILRGGVTVRGNITGGSKLQEMNGGTGVLDMKLRGIRKGPYN